MNTHMSEVLGFEFDDNVRPYSVFNIMQSITVFTFLSIEAFIKTRTQYFIFHIIAGSMGAIMCSITLGFPFKSKE